MNIDKTISSECVVCFKSTELCEHYYGVGLAHRYSSHRLVVAPLYYNEDLNEGYCSPGCATIGYNRTSSVSIRQS